MRRFPRRRALGLAPLGLAVAGLLPARLALASGGGEPAGPPNPVFLPLGDFTVNLHGKSEQFGFIVVSVTIEVAPAAANPLKDIMPRLKEAVMRRLMGMADRGALLPGQVDPVILKAALSDTLTKLNPSPDSIREVLITRLLYG